MKIKLAYPKIPDTLDCPLRQCVAFEKLDGTNIHIVYSKGQWVGFGTRRDRFPSTEQGAESFGQAHPELKGVLDADTDMLWELNKYLDGNPKYNEAKEVIIFFEYCGPNSFAGQHSPKDEKHLYLIDVQINDKILPPEEFLQDFDNFKSQMPKVIFKGKFTGQLFVDVRKNKYNLKEGVVVKGVVGDQVYMAKIKTEAYLERLKKEFKDNWKEYWE
jgi:hypothetical protein